MSAPVVVAFSQGWTVEVSGEESAQPYVYLDWVRTGSMDPNLPDMTAWEAREFAEALLDAADRVEGKK